MLDEKVGAAGEQDGRSPVGDQLPHPRDQRGEIGDALEREAREIGDGHRAASSRRVFAATRTLSTMRW